MAPTSQPAASAAPSARNMTFRSTNSFAPGGVLSRTHPAYEFRRGQLQMAQAVEQALEEKRHLIVEAGTGHGQDPGVSGAGDSLRQAGHHFHRHQESAGATLLQRYPVSRTSAFSRRRRQAERLLHEGAQQLSLPEEALRPDRPAGAERLGGDRALPRHRRLGKDDADRRPGGTGVAA